MSVPPAAPGRPAGGIEVEANAVAPLLGLHPAEFRKLMQAGKISTLCERGVGADEGTFRATFYWRRQRARLVLDADGRILASDPPPAPRPPPP